MAPNILIFLTDDHAQWALPCYGNHEIVAPSLDFLAEGGVRMANAFTPTPVCSPARGSFWTGLYPSQHGIHDYLAEHEDAIGARNWLDGIPLLAEHMQAAGYQTGLAGKWHCGLGEVPKPGFDYWYSAWRQTPKYHSITAKYSNQGDVQTIAGFESQIITDGAVRCLRQRDHDRPFFLFVGLASTHSPWINRPERLVSHYRRASFSDIPDDIPYPFGEHGAHPVKPDDVREAAAQYYAAVTQIDEMIGRVLDELDAQGVRDETLLIYTADHGLNVGQHQVWGKGNATHPLNMLDESIRVPLILRHPGLLPAAAVNPAFVNHIDLFMTLLDFAYATPADTSASPGRSFKDVLTDSAKLADWDNTVIGEYGNVRMIRMPEYKLVLFYPDGPHLLFDMQRDPRENTNLYGQPGYEALTAELRGRIEAFFAQYEVAVHSGLQAPDLPPHNPAEAWR